MPLIHHAREGGYPESIETTGSRLHACALKRCGAQAMTKKDVHGGPFSYDLKPTSVNQFFFCNLL